MEMGLSEVSFSLRVHRLHFLTAHIASFEDAASRMAQYGYIPTSLPNQLFTNS